MTGRFPQILYHTYVFYVPTLFFVRSTNQDQLFQAGSTDCHILWQCLKLNADATPEKLEVGKILFECFSNSFLKANAGKCHDILSMDEPFSINIDNEVIENSNNKKLLGINLNNRLGFDTHVANICN